MEYSLVVQNSETVDFRFGKLEFNEIGVSSKSNRLGILRIFSTMVPTTNQQIDSKLIVVLGIPSFLVIKDFLTLVREHIHHCEYIREINDSVKNRKMMILKFKSSTNASDFYMEFHGKKFNSFEPEICNLAYVKEIVIEEGDGIIEDFGLEALMNDLKLVKEIKLPNSVELPSCVVCLERLDSSITGLFTTLCSHTFHCNCIMRWGDSTCPVCRYSSVKTNDSSCASCSIKENLWICLICGNVGCGRYFNRHAFEHFTASGHRYSLEAESQRVWDYSGDGYVHRIIQNNDGKLVQLPPHNPIQAAGRYPGIELDASRIGLDMHDPDSSVIPQDILYAQKIESMRQFQNVHDSLKLKDQLQFTEMQHISAVECYDMKLDALQSYCLKLESQLHSVEKELSDSKRSADQLAFKLSRTEARIRDLQSKAVEENVFNDSLTKNLKDLNSAVMVKDSKIEAQQVEINELKDQLRDLMFFLDAQNRAQTDQDLSHATVLGVNPNSVPSSPSPRKGKKKK